MATPSKPSYDHGSTGTEPPSPRDYTNGDTLDADELDYYIYESFSTIKSLIDAVDDLDSVSSADYAADADKLDGNDWGDIKFWVENNAEIDLGQINIGNGAADQYLRTDGSALVWSNLKVPVRSSDPIAEDGEMWIRDDI